jgi:hypothetical protein
MTADAKHEPRPGFQPRRLVHLMRQAVERCRLDLSGRVVLTEAASGAYVVTPVLAAMAGARRVHALTRTTAYGTAEEITAQTLALAAEVGVAERIEISTRKSAALVEQADIVTNSGHVRPIDGEMVGWMKPSAVIPLMFEAWELRPRDVDVAGCRRRGVQLAGTNERHRAVDVFSFLGLMALTLLIDAGISVYANRLLVLCDNPFGPFLKNSLTASGASVDLVERLEEAAAGVEYDAVLVALRPDVVLGAKEAATIGRSWPNAVVAQYFGDVDRSAFGAAGVAVWPEKAPPTGHMGILPSALGPDPIVRLQAGGLKVGELLSRPAAERDPGFTGLLQLI